MSSVTEISGDDLMAQDLDTPPDELQFMVTPPSNGHLALKSAPMKAVLNFTQTHINQGQLLFVHKGNTSLQVRLFNFDLMFIYRLYKHHKHSLNLLTSEREKKS